MILSGPSIETIAWACASSILLDSRQKLFLEWREGAAAPELASLEDWGFRTTLDVWRFVLHAMAHAQRHGTAIQVTVVPRKEPAAVGEGTSMEAAG